MMMVIMMVAMTTFKPIQIFPKCTTSQDECVWLSVFSIRNRLFLFFEEGVSVHRGSWRYIPCVKGTTLDISENISGGDMLKLTRAYTHVYMSVHVHLSYPCIAQVCPIVKKHLVERTNLEREIKVN